MKMQKKIDMFHIFAFATSEGGTTGTLRTLLTSVLLAAAVLPALTVADVVTLLSHKLHASFGTNWGWRSGVAGGLGLASP